MGSGGEGKRCCGGTSEAPGGQELLPARLREERGQALLLALGGALALIVAALALVAIAGAVTGKGRAQRAADLAAISAARSMRDDLPRLLSPPLLPNGLPNPAHLEKTAYLWRARAAALEVAKANGVGVSRLRVSFPDRASFAPVRVRAVVVAELDAGRAGEGRIDADSARRGGSVSGRTGGTAAATPVPVEASAIAEAAAPATGGGAMPAMASGGGYSGPLARRQGEGMRPDVAAAFDRLATAAARAGSALLVNSAYRSDAEQATLFAAHSRPALGGAARPLPAPLRHRARPRPGLRLRLAGRERRPFRLRAALLLGALALRVAFRRY